ncbi:hypothetical protein Btru_076840 [Bulinus truncatus]|nr:hypothetical protein Btru_076840 [Bulinus truncatus]
MVDKNHFMVGFCFWQLIFSLQCVKIVSFEYNQSWEEYFGQLKFIDDAVTSEPTIPKETVLLALNKALYAIDSDFMEKIDPEVIKQTANEFARMAMTKGLGLLCYYVRNVFKAEDFSTWNYWDFRKYSIALLCFKSEDFLLFNVKEITDYFDDLLPVDPSFKMFKMYIDPAIIKIMADYWRKNKVKDDTEMQRIKPYYLIDPFLIISIPEDMVFYGVRFTSGPALRSAVGRLLLEQLVAYSSVFGKAAHIGTAMLRLEGQLTIGWDPGVASQIDPGVLMENLHLLRTYNFDRVLCKKLAESIIKEHGDTFDDEKLEEMGFLAQGIPAEKFRQVNRLYDVASSLDGLALNEVQMKVIAYRVVNTDLNQFLKLKRLAAVVSPATLKEKMTDEFVYKNIFQIQNVRWTLEQATVLIEKYKRQLRQALHISSTVMLGTVLKGLSTVELMGLIKSEQDAIQMGYYLLENDASSTQIQGIVNSFRKVTSLSEFIKVGLTQEAAFKLARHLAHMNPTFLKNLKLSKQSESIFVKSLSTMSIVKMPIPQIKFLYRFLRVLLLKDVKIAQEDQDAAMISRLGVMALGMTPADIESLTPETVLRSLDMLGQLPLSAAQSHAVMNQLNKAEPKWKCRLHIVAKTGTILQFNSDVFKLPCHDTFARSTTRFVKQIIRREAILDARRKAGFVRESEIDNSEKGMEALVTKLLDSLARATPITDDITTSRIRIRTLRCTYLRMLKSAVSHVAPGYFMYMPQAELAKCIPYLGQVKRWTADHVDALLNLVLEYIGVDFKRWNESRIQDMGSLLSGLTAEHLEEFKIYEVETLSMIAAGPKLSYDKAYRLLHNWITRAKDGYINRIKTEEFSSLSQFLCVFTPQDIAQLPDSLFMDGLKSVGEQKCSHEVAQAYYDKLSGILGGISVEKWPRDVLMQAAPLISLVKPDEILKLKPDQLSELHPETIYEMSTEIFQKLSVMQLTFLTPMQSEVIKEAQYNALPGDKKVALDFYAAYSAKCSIVKCGVTWIIAMTVGSLISSFKY